MANPRDMRGEPGLFLDRDGVINVEKNYVYRIEDFEFMPGIFDLCRLAVGRGYRIIVITNQAGIGRGYYSEEAFQGLTRWMVEAFAAEKAAITAVYHCPYHPEHGIGEYRRESRCRKPNPGMLLDAASDWNLILTDSVLVGDKPSDIEAGRAAGVGCNILLDPASEFVDVPASACVSSLHEVTKWLATLGQEPIRWD